MSRIRSVLTILLLVLIGILCLPTAGDAAFAAPSAIADITRQNAVVAQGLVVIEETPAAGSPTIDESRARALATSYLGTSSQATSIQAQYVTLTVRDDRGEIAWGVQARPVWLVTFQGSAYPAPRGTSDCSCQAYYWRPNTVVALDAGTGARVINLGVAS